MKSLDWTMIVYVSSTLLHEYWLLTGLPRIYYWDVKRQHVNKVKEAENLKRTA
ncbi:hypothetical protein MUN88_00740 [Gracilibacillus caseinilyticus]|uniref:Uncharacterized protein n=1 Tax=Gracilibacillus caseinilyticus TaxID=2932256 RepID=A0ABY4EXZ4_9BACI|nr:hypothetical protein [Gracilibacillus caseinilyticus]UOQ48723.1 hypothetical protein MUN88_00740 [Gracilibacillus caseinilyticus]